MKTKLFTALTVTVAALVPGVPAVFAAQIEVPLKLVKGPNNLFHDAEYGVSLTYPAGWELVRGFHWGRDNSETTFVLRRVRPLVATTSVSLRDDRGPAAGLVNFPAAVTNGGLKSTSHFSGHRPAARRVTRDEIYTLLCSRSGFLANRSRLKAAPTFKMVTGKLS